ncbi:MAG: SRPBCC domain-containing protein [Cyanobacteria bacterium P01_H01_bin.21]
METLDYDVRINASKPSIWSTLTETEKYTKWVKAFSPNSYADGEWKQGTYIKFLDPDMGGTKAFIEALETNERILVRHISMISKEGEESTDGEIASHWIGTTEEYRLIGENDATSLKIQIKTHSDFVPMFESCWPEALRRIKELSE